MQKGFQQETTNTPPKIRYFDGFSGIGGFAFAIQSILPEAECVGFSEIDKYAIQIYEKHFAKHKNFGDITRIDTKELPDFDLFTSGFPCQSFSIAGKRLGFEDTRGTMFFEVARILRDKRPRYFILENVKGLLSHDEGKTLQTIFGILTDLGYEYQWQVLNSKNFGVPQNRERIFIVGNLRGIGRPEVFPITQSSESHLKYSGGVISAREQWLKDGKTNSRNFSQGQRIYSEEGISQTLAGNAGGQGGKTGLYEIIDKKGNSKKKDYASTITGGAHSGGNHSDMDLLKIENPLKGKTPYGWHFEQNVYSDTGLVRSLKAGEGSGNKPKVIQEMSAMQWRRTQKGKEARRISQQQGRDYTPFGDGNRELVPVEGKPIGTITSQAVAKDSLIGNTTQIRRLTPTECERLQGFPDEWTEGISDTQRYKCLGNAVTTNVVRAVAERLLDTSSEAVFD